MPSDDCPTKDELTEYVAAGGEEGDEVGEHIRACVTCRRRAGNLEDAFQFVHGAAENGPAENGAASEEPPPGLVDRITDRLKSQGCWPGLSSTFPAAVTQTAIADQDDFVDCHGDEAGHAKIRKHDELVLPIIDEHGGSQLRNLGSVRLMMFDAVRDAARFALAAQRRLLEYNRSGDPPDPDHEIHLHIGVHWGRVVQLADAFGLECHVDVTRVVGAVADAGDDDEILLSEAAASRLRSGPRDLELAEHGTTHLTGFGALRLFRLLWREEELADPAPMRLAAKTSVDEPGELESFEFARGIHCMFVNESTGRGYVRPVFSKVVHSDETSVTCNVECDEVMRASARRAVEAARTVLEGIGFPRADVAVGWWIQGDDVYEGASLGLGMALATIAAHAGVTVDPSMVATGAIDSDGRVGRVASIERKLPEVRRLGFRAVLLPEENLAELAPERRPAGLELIPVTTLDEAMRAVLGPALGLADRELERVMRRGGTARDLEPQNILLDPVGEPRSIDFGLARPERAMNADQAMIELWIETGAAEASTRPVGFGRVTRSWRVGDRIRICARADRDCHLTIVNIGSTGNVDVLAPGSADADTSNSPGRMAMYPPDTGQDTFELLGPPGPVRIIALASEAPLNLIPEDLCRPSAITTRLADVVIGHARLDFYVSGAQQPRSRSIGGRPRTPEPEYRALDLG